ncbi:hypothetical protein [Streptomyces sp. NBC_00829]|uniref:hypothetical protein n=1 Tax=Streptomyces sp. NBC_00829 TaxID=2903679 RepID=UPI0038697698|nr:hypothetical protein OG293_16085 [Streptomyces sp. NBC_00829]
MGWTYDYGDAGSNRRSASGPVTQERGGPRIEGHEHPGQGIGIPRILRRRARWVSARLRHTRG